MYVFTMRVFDYFSTSHLKMYDMVCARTFVSGYVSVCVCVTYFFMLICEHSRVASGSVHLCRVVTGNVLSVRACLASPGP